MRSLAFRSPGARFSDGEPRVLADDLLDEVFTNILSNSVKFTEGAQVHIQVELKDEEEPVKPENAVETSELENSKKSNQIPLEEATQGISRFWKISITDQGRGIPDELKDSLFMRYLGTAKGSGLGLSIVRALCGREVFRKGHDRQQSRGRPHEGYSGGGTDNESLAVLSR